MPTLARHLTLILLTAALLGCTRDDAPPPRAKSRLVSSDVTYALGRELDVYRPAVHRGGPLPVVVMVHGCCGDRSDLSKLAEATAAAGAVVMNVDWTGIRGTGQYPRAWQEIACAVRFARGSAARYGGEAANVTLLGWSDGAMAGATAALAGDRLDADRCVEPLAPPHPDRFVGVAGFYGWRMPVPLRDVSSRALRFFGGSPRSVPGRWHAASPYTWVGRCRAMPFDLLVGLRDPLRTSAGDFARSLREHGHPVQLDVIAPKGDQSLISPRTGEGRRVVSVTVHPPEQRGTHPATRQGC